MNNELVQYIKTYFGVSNSEDQTKIASFFKLEKLNRGDYFLKGGHVCHKFSFIREGILRVFAYHNGKEVTQWIATPGYFVTDLGSFIFNKEGSWVIQTSTDVELFTIDRSDYVKLIAQVPAWNSLEKLFLVSCFGAMEQRIFQHLSLTAEERYQVFFEANSELFNEVPLHYIASMLGMTPETFSRIRKKRIK